jgi:hypothetical protein
MDRDGYKRVSEALKRHKLDHLTITPEPGDDEDVPYVTLGSREFSVVGARVLNALDVEGLGKNRNLMNRDSGPELVIAGQTDYSITLEDRLARPPEVPDQFY